MKKKFNRGFSFVELLAAIVIMGLLSGLAIVSIRFLLNKAEKEYYKAQESEIIMAAKSYTQDNRNHLPKRVGLKTQIFLSTLQEKKYIGDVVDRSKKKCFPDQSYVQVYRYDKNHYSYVVDLVCDRYKSTDNEDSDITSKPTIKINFLNVSKTDKYSDAKVRVTIEDDHKISSYSYIIMRDNEEIKNSGDIDGKLKEKLTVDIPLKDYVPGKITVKVVATNTLGNQGNAKDSVTVKNETAPTCEVIRDNSVKDVNGNPTCEGRWIKDPTQATVEAQVKCIDKSGSGCQKDVYTQVFFGERKTDFISMADNTGNTAPCEVYVCIDVTKPTTPVIDNPYEGIWINKSYSIKISSYDKTAGIAYFEYRYPDSTGVDGNGVSEKEWHQWANSSKDPGDTTPFVTTPFSKERDEYVEVRACDRAGNCSDIARSKIRIDKTDPTCTITKNKANPDGLNNWYVTNVNLKLNPKNDHGSGDRAVDSPISYELKNTNSASYNGTTTGTQTETKGITWYGFIKDEAGNKTSCNSGSFKVDTTKPDKPSITNRNDNKWVNKSYTISVVSKDATSGIDYFAYRYPSSNSPGENTWNKYANSSRNPGDNTAFTTTNFSKERDENVEIMACDVAGNCSDTSSSRIRIDKTAPTCTVTRNIAQPNGNNNWYKTNVTLTINRNDVKGSGDRAVNSPVSYGVYATNSENYDNRASKTQSDISKVTWYGFVKDEAGNKSTCNSGSFKVDTTAPTCTVNRSGTAGRNNWYRSNVSLSLSTNDNMSGVDTYDLKSTNSVSYNKNTTATITYETNKINWYGFVKDKAGNTNSCSTTFGIDKTSPTVWSEGHSESTTWCTGKRVSASCSDDRSGVYDYGTSRSTVSSTVRYTCEDNAGNTDSMTKHFTVVDKKCVTYNSCRHSSFGCAEYSRTLKTCLESSSTKSQKASGRNTCSELNGKGSKTCEARSGCIYRQQTCAGEHWVYSCPNNTWTLSGKTCYKTVYSYSWSTTTTKNSSCTVRSSFTCNSSNADKAYTSSCSCNYYNSKAAYPCSCNTYNCSD